MMGAVWGLPPERTFCRKVHLGGGRHGGRTIGAVDFSPGIRGFYAFARAVGVELAPFQRTIARAAYGPAREIVAVLPRGNAKSTLAALLAVHHVLTHPNPSVYVGAGSRQQARVIGRIVERYARHPAVKRRLIVRHDELRLSKHDTVLQVVASDGGQAHGWERPTLMLGDECWQWADREPTLLGAMQTALIKNPEAKLLIISTSAASLDTPLGRLRARALALPDQERRGAVLEARGGGLHWLEWSLPPDADPADARAVKAANPAPWIGTGDLADQRARVTEIEYLQFHCCRWGVGEGAWLPPGAWRACVGDCEADGEPAWLGVDIGGSRAASALIGVTDDLRVCEVHIFQGDEAVLEVTDRVLEIATRRPVVELAFDPWRYQAEALRLEREHGLRVVQFPQSHSRMTAASENLHRVIVEGKLTHPGHAELDRHVAAAVARKTGRGWRLDKLTKAAQIDAVVALAMAAERAEARPEPARILAWV